MAFSRRTIALAALGAPLLATRRASAQTLPLRRMIVPFPAGGAVDMIGRLLVEVMGPSTGGRAVVENIGGAGAMLGIANVANSAPDGSTAGIASVSNLITNKYLFSKMLYDPDKGLVPVTRIATGTILCVVNAKKAEERGWKTFRDMILWGKANPGKINFGSSGLGQTSHLTQGLLNARTGIGMVHIPYRGGAPAISDLLTGNIDVMFDTMAALLPNVAAGTFKALAVASAERQPFLPDVPGMKEFADLGLGDIDIQAWFSIVMPSATPEAIVADYHKALLTAVDTKLFRERMTAAGLSVVTDPSTAALKDLIKRENPFWEELVKVAGVKLD
jgi:tripartite-type tricarboxylate transporter receptor subunit TctC